MKITPLEEAIVELKKLWKDLDNQYFDEYSKYAKRYPGELVLNSWEPRFPKLATIEAQKLGVSKAIVILNTKREVRT